ncbi:pilin [Stenotrophomonas rhizophila]|uniref:pilin n=1 Tax=Stenotrophomonas TaxID=40323 RepID=UPI003B81BB58
MKKQQGFTLIELMIVVAIIAILAAIALPAYRDYTIRAKVSESVMALSACKTSVTEYFSATNALPTTLAEAGCNAATADISKYVDHLAISGTDGAITVTTQDTGATAAECELTLTPTVNETTNEITEWVGTHAGCAAKFVPSNFRDGGGA